MKLNLKDRVLILKSVLPPYDSRRGIELKNSIERKIKLSSEEADVAVLTNKGYDQYELSFKVNDLVNPREEKDFSLTDEELKYLKEKVDFLDRDGRFSDYTLQTYSKIADEPLHEPVEEPENAVGIDGEETVSDSEIQPEADEEETFAH